MLATYFRIALAPSIILILFWDHPWRGAGAALLFTLCALSDWFDGYWARKYNAITEMGKLLDPTADKLLLTAALIVLLSTNKIDPFLVFLLLARDIAVNNLRFLEFQHRNKVLPSSSVGKWKSALQMIFLPLLMATDTFSSLQVLEPILYYGLWGTVILSGISLVQYSKVAFTSTQKNTKDVSNKVF